MKIFNFVKNEILKEMPSGLLVTQSDINYDIGYWQHKTYENNNLIFEYLRGKWCPSTINLLIMNDDATNENFIKYLKDNSFEKGQRSTYLTYCISIKTSILTNQVIEFSRSNRFLMSNYSNRINFEEYTIFINDFVKHLLYY